VITIIKQRDLKNKPQASKRPKSSRRPGIQYSEQELIIIYLKKYASLGRPPSISEINSDPDLPSYWTFLRRLGDKDLICKKLSLANIPAEIHRQDYSDFVEKEEDNIRNYFENEVKPHVPEAWVDYSYTRVGYEIPFTRYFYEFEELEPSHKIKEEIHEIESEISQLMEQVLEMGEVDGI